MLEFPEQRDPLTERIIGCAIEVHRTLGPGLLESTYEGALAIEFEAANLTYQRQLIIPVSYKGHLIGEHRLDFLIEDTVVLELKSVERFDPIFEAQVLAHLRISGKHRGLLINFNSRLLKDGVKRYVFKLCALGASMANLNEHSRQNR
jgi:GxxExxY protein